MKKLLDTHAFLWFVLGDSRLGAAASFALVNPDNTLFLSPASYWEIAIKLSLGKYVLKGDFEPFMEQQISENDLRVLPISIRHASLVATLPFHHRDPFDRMLIAQAMAEQIPLVSGDRVLDAYPVARIW